MKSKHDQERREKASEILSKQGYGKMKHLVEQGVHEHEDADHKGTKKTKLKLADGGCASGGSPMARLDRKSRAKGGRNKGHKEPKVSVNVINAGKQPVPVPVQGGGMSPRPPMAAPQAMPPRPMPPQGAPPPPMQMKPPGMMNAGGRAKKSGGGPVASKGNDVPHLKGGSGGGLGRLEKSQHEKSRKGG